MTNDQRQVTKIHPFAFRLYLSLLTLIAFGLRVQGLSTQPLWGDEGYSVYAAVLPLREMLAATAVDIHPPLYYALLHGWFGLLGPGAESARFLSVVFGTLLVPLIYVFGRHILRSERGGLIVAAVATVAPMAIYYSQEVRMYSLVTTLGLASTFFFTRTLSGEKKARLPYILVSALALYANYYAAFILLAQVVYLLIRYRGRLPLFKSLLWIALLYLPWIAYAGSKLATYVQDKREADADLPLGLARFLWAHAAAFSVGHVSQAWLLPLATVFAVIALLGLWNLSRRQSVGAIWIGAYLLVPLLLGWGVNRLFPFNPRYFERTLLLAAPAWWTLIGAGLLWLWRKRIMVGVGASMLVLAISAAGLLDFYTVPRYAKVDYRPLLAEVTARATPDDTLAASFEWQLGYYHAYLPAESRPQLFAVPGWGVGWGTNTEAMRADLTRFLERGAVWFPAHQALGHLWEDQAETILAQTGFPAVEQWYGPETKLTLTAPQAELLPGPTMNFGGVFEAQVELPAAAPFESGRGIIPLSITWTATVDHAEDYLITLKLVDVAGEIWAVRDVPLADEPLFAGQTVSARHGVLISAGTPPGNYTLKLSLTRQADERPLDILDSDGQPQGVAATLMPVTVIPPALPVGAAALAMQTETEANFNDRLILAGYSIGARQAKTGDLLPVNLFWQGRAAGLSNLITFVQIQNENGAVAVSERPPVYPATEWADGTLLRDVHRLRIPADLSAGTYTLAAGVLLPDKTRLATSAGDQVALGTLTVEARPHNFQPPQPQHPLSVDFGGRATLIGYDLEPSTGQSGNSLLLTLYWRGDAGFQREWAIFAHVIDAEGRIWGQRDQFPGDGHFPTPAWVTGETITDTRQIPLNADMPPGNYRVEVGLYDPMTFERLPVSTGEDAVLLDTSVMVE